MLSAGRVPAACVAGSRWRPGMRADRNSGLCVTGITSGDSGEIRGCCVTGAALLQELKWQNDTISWNKHVAGSGSLC